MILESMIVAGKVVLYYLYIPFIIILIGMIGIVGLMRILIWLIDGNK